MNKREFVALYDRWSNKAWHKGNLLAYWESAGLYPEDIFTNRESLEERMTTLAITGSVGKTTLSRILRELLFQEGHDVYLTMINDNWLPQLPFAVEMAIRSNLQLGIFECGVASKGDAELMSETLPTDRILYTEFSDVNLEELGTIKGVAEEKMELARSPEQTMVVSHVHNAQYFKKKKWGSTIFYGPEKSNSEIAFRMLRMGANYTEVEVFTPQQRYVITLPDIGMHLGISTAGAIAGFKAMIGEYPSASEIGLTGYKNPRQRMQHFDYKGIEVIIDTANANTLSSINALRTFFAIETDKPKNIVLGGIYGLAEDTQNITIGNLMREILSFDLESLQSLHFVGAMYKEYESEIRQRLGEKVHFYKDQKSLAEELQLEQFRDQLLLLRSPTLSGINFSNILVNYDGSSDETAPKEILA